MVVIIKRHLGERRRCVAELKRAAASGTGDLRQTTPKASLSDGLPFRMCIMRLDTETFCATGHRATADRIAMLYERGKGKSGRDRHFTKPRRAPV